MQNMKKIYLQTKTFVLFQTSENIDTLRRICEAKFGSRKAVNVGNFPHQRIFEEQESSWQSKRHDFHLNGTICEYIPI